MSVVTVIIPAYNEAPRLAEVVETVRAASLVHEIIVVDDGSLDDTARVARGLGVRVVRLPENLGKGSAMRAGAQAATGDILLFLDADLRNLAPEQVDSLIRPVLEREAGMTIGIFRGGRAATDLAQVISPHLSGQRCLPRDFFLAAPLVGGSRSGVEIALTVHARACKLAIQTVELPGATHTMKEEKIGIVRGTLARWRMYTDILATLIRYHVATRAQKRFPVHSE
ncbi:MAG: Glucosyl-3-phosphoglycerate synthase [bacterium ADurb.Bin429]|nr:MAG: Glucosyl-3-phosphoglycerate synthase [bacterium ADurb.Bin429]